MEDESDAREKAPTLQVGGLSCQYPTRVRLG